MAQDSPHSRAGSSISLRSLVDRVVKAWLEDYDLSEQTIRRLIETSQKFRDFLQSGERVSFAEEIARSHVRSFVTAPFASELGPQKPAIATMRLRRACLRLLFRTARQLAVFEGDPTLDLQLPPRLSLKTRPLSDEEVALCRSFSLHTLTETRRPAAWALAEATARTSEIPHIRGSDLDLEQGRVWIHGSPRSVPRWGMFTRWGLTQTQRRADALKKLRGDPPLVYRGEGSAESQQAASCIAIADTLVRAGLGREPDVRPASVVAWAGVRIFEETGRIDEVARRLGIRSLDRAARLIDWDWKS